MEIWKLSATCMDREITAAITRLDEGYLVMLAGGSRTHVGAVSSAGYGDDLSFQFPSHRDEVLSKSWARALEEVWHEPVVVVCGIHYDGVNKEEIAQIVDVCGKLLQAVLKKVPARTEVNGDR